MRITSGPSHETLQNGECSMLQNKTYSQLFCETLFLCKKVFGSQNVNFLWISFCTFFSVFFAGLYDRTFRQSVWKCLFYSFWYFNKAVFQRLLSEVIIMRHMSCWCTCGVPAIPKRTPLGPPFPFVPDPFISASTSKWWAATLPDANSPHERESVWGASIGDWRGLLGVPLLFFSIKPGSLFPSF